MMDSNGPTGLPFFLSKLSIGWKFENTFPMDVHLSSSLIVSRLLDRDPILSFYSRPPAFSVFSSDLSSPSRSR